MADMRDRHRNREVIERFCPGIVFHAAALKQLPLLECCPAEALKSNVLGTLTVLEAAADHGVRSFVMARRLAGLAGSPSQGGANPIPLQSSRAVLPVGEDWHGGAKPSGRPPPQAASYLQLRAASPPPNPRPPRPPPLPPPAPL